MNATPNRYSIGVVTYHARYDKYFMPLIERLAEVFPDREILCIINGHPDRTLQISYLNKITRYLSRFPNVRYLTYDLHQSLSKCWNQLVILSRTEKILIMNDDTQVTELFRQEFETKVINVENRPFSTLNVSWSHFLISKDTIRQIGWFEERLLGVGYEDADYALRMAMAGLAITNTTCLGLNNYVVDQEDPGWKSISGKLGESKYTSLNLDFFKTKWQTIDLNPEIRPEDFKYKLIFHGNPFPFSPIDTEPMPMYYDYGCLDANEDNQPGRNAKSENAMIRKLRVSLQHAFYFSKLTLKKIYRKLKK